MIQFGQLRLSQGHFRALVISARVHLAFIQPQLVKVIAEIIVAMHIVSGARARMPAQGQQQTLKFAQVVATTSSPGKGPREFIEYIQHIPVYIDLALAIALAKANPR